MYLSARRKYRNLSSETSLRLRLNPANLTNHSQTVYRPIVPLSPQHPAGTLGGFLGLSLSKTTRHGHHGLAATPKAAEGVRAHFPLTDHSHPKCSQLDSAGAACSGSYERIP